MAEATVAREPILSPVVQSYLDGLIADINRSSDELQALHDAINAKREHLESKAKELTIATEKVATALGIDVTDLVCVDGHAVIRKR